MKIAIQGHLSRGHEVIQILESLGGKNTALKGTFPSFYYIDNKNEITNAHDKFLRGYKLYTLKEFKKEFPFKVGDKVITTNGIIGIIDEFKPEEDYPYCIRTDDGIFYWCVTSTLKPYKEMKEERNITLTLEKAKEWYSKGGELKEIALQAFTEKELTKVDLPKTWEEFCDNYPVKGSEAMIDCNAEIIDCNSIQGKREYNFKDIMLSQKSAEAHLALIQLEQLRDCWRQGWVPDYTKTYKKYRIKKLGTEYIVDWSTGLSDFLVFQTEELAKEFLECFRDLIEKAGDLI